MSDLSGRTPSLYETPWDALYAGISAAGASLYGTARPHTDSLGGRTGCGAWTDHDKAERIADGLRLTGYEVVLLPGYSTGVVVLDPMTAPASTPSSLHTPDSP